MFIVMCRVSGGLTGTREAPLKSNGVVRYFQTEADAQAEADRLNALPREHSIASYRYWVEAY